MPKSPGDTASMLKARRNFLEEGRYDRLARLVADDALDHIRASGDDEAYIAEIGSGEGYYIGLIRRYLRESGKDRVHCLGMDRSRDAARMAAKKYRDATFFVADVWKKVVLADSSIRVMLDIFAPRNPDEFARVLEPGGLLIIVIPGTAHLKELRGEFDLINMETGKKDHVMARFSEDFHLVRERILEYGMNLDGDSLIALIGMTPNSRHISFERLECLNDMSRHVTASFIVLEFEKCRPKPAAAII